MGPFFAGQGVLPGGRGMRSEHKCLLHKVATWVTAFLSEPHTKSSGKRRGNSQAGSLSVLVLSRNPCDGEGIQRICPRV